MKVSIVVLLLLFAANMSQAQCKKISFLDSSVTYAQKKAKKEDKKIFIFLFEKGKTKTRLYESAVFNKKDVCKLFNKEFINLKVDANSSLGKKLVKKYKIDKSPYLLILSESGKLLGKSGVIKNTRDLIKFGEKAIK